MILSIIIPAYNGERFIAGCIRSLLTGGDHDIEILVVDDGSSDRTAAVTEALEGPGSPVRLIHQENRGPGGARNTGLREAKGEWIWFIDCDDVIVPGAVSYLCENIAAYRDVDIFVMSEKWTFDDPSKDFLDIPLPPPVCDMTGREALRNHSCPAWGPHRFVFRKSLTELPLVHIPERLYFEDEYFGVALLYSASRIHILDKCVYHYIQHGESITHNRCGKNIHDMYEIYKLLCQFTDSDRVAPEDKGWLNRRNSLFIMGKFRSFRDVAASANYIRPLLPEFRKEYNHRIGPRPLHTRLRDELRFIRARFRK